VADDNDGHRLLREGHHKEAQEWFKERLGSGSTPQDEALLLADVALAALLQDSFFWAQRYISGALELDPDCLYCLWIAAVSTARTGNWEEGSAQADRFLALGGADTTGWMSLIRGVAAYKRQQFPLALRYLSAARDSSGARRPDPDVRTAADLYISAIRRMQARGYPFFDGQVRLGWEYDSNVTMDETDLAGPGASFRGTALVALTLRPIRGFVVTEGWFQGYQSLHTTSEADDFDVTLLRSGFRLVFPSLMDLHMGYDFGVTLLGGGPKAEQDALYVFQESHGAHAGATLLAHERSRITATYSVAGRFHETVRRDVMRHQLDLSLGWFCPSGKHKFYLVPRLILDDSLAIMDSYDLWSAGASLVYSGSLPWSLGLSAQVGVQHWNYYRSAGDFGVDDVRTDTVLRGNLGVTRPLWKSLSAGLGYGYTRSLSPVPAFDYDRHVFSSFLAWRFE
jgi:hypothetical protein